MPGLSKGPEEEDSLAGHPGRRVPWQRRYFDVVVSVETKTLADFRDTNLA
jgi:hypothetical protein